MNPTDADLLVEEANRLDGVLREHLQEGKLAEAVVLARKVLSLREEVYGPEHPAVARSLDNLGGLEYATGARGAAAALYGRSALLWLKALGPKHDQVGASVLNVLLLAEQAHAASPPFSFSATALAIAQEGAALDETSATTLLNTIAGQAFNNGSLAAADELYSEVLARRERALGPSHEDLALPVANLAAARRKRGDLRACEALLARAIAIEEGRPGGPTDMLDTYLHNRTAVLITQERFAEAEAMARRVLELTQRRSGAGGLEEANALNSLGVILSHADKLEEAEICMRGAFAACERLAADQPAVVAKIQGNLAGVMLARGRATEAESLMRRSLETLEATLGPEHIEVAGALEAVAELVRMQGRLDEAEPALRRALEIRERTQGAEHPGIIPPLTMLATVLGYRGQPGAAEPLLLRALRIVEAVHGPDELATVAVLTGLGSLYRDRGDFAAAEASYRRALGIAEARAGRDSQRSAECLRLLGGLAVERGRYDEGAELTRRALTSEAQRLGVDHPSVALACMALAEAELARGQLGEAETVARQAVDVMERAASGGDDVRLALALSGLASVLHARGDHPGARAALHRALDMRRRQLGEDHVAVADSCARLADFEDEDLLEAERLARKALAIFERVLGSEHPRFGACLQVLGKLLMRRAEVVAAEIPLRQAIACFERALGPDHPNVASTRVVLSLALFEQGQYGAAGELLERAQAGLVAALGHGHPQVATALCDVGGQHLRRGDYRAADRALRQALEQEEKTRGPAHPAVVTVLLHLARLRAEMGAEEESERFARRALEVARRSLGPASEVTVIALRTVAAVLAVRGRRDEPMGLLLEALAILERRAPDSPRVGDIRRNIAALHLLLGVPAEAEPLLRAAITAFERAWGPEHVAVGETMAELATALTRSGRRAEATPIFARALAILEASQGAANSHVADKLISFAACVWAEGARGAALPLLCRALDISELNRRLCLGAGSEEAKLAFLNTLPSLTSVVVSFAVEGAGAEFTRLAAEAVLAEKGRVLEALAQDNSRLRARLAVDDRAAFDDLLAARAALARIAFGALLGAGSSEGTPVRQRISALEGECRRLEELLHERGAAADDPERCSPESVVATLPAGAAVIDLVEYKPFSPFAAIQRELWGPARYAAIVLRRDASPKLVDLGPSQSIDDRVRAFRHALTRGGVDDVREQGRALDEVVMQPLRSWLGDETHLFVAPDGELNLVPFEALVDEAGRYLVERFLFTYCSSGRDLIASAASGAQPREPALVVANPAYDLTPGEEAAAAVTASGAERRRSPSHASAGQRFAPLPGTEKEGRAVSALLSGARLLVGAAATESAILGVAGPRVLHIATHGFFLPNAPRKSAAGAAPPSGVPIENPLLRSGLVFAGVNRRDGEAPRDDGLLTALELAGVDLAGCQLCVLSACETGLGDVRNGEGVLGLRRALAIAGARTQVMSLWRVNDRATCRLMESFYGHLGAGRGRAEALRAAKLELLGRSATAHPNLWASFICSGAPSPLP